MARRPAQRYTDEQLAIGAWGDNERRCDRWDWLPDGDRNAARAATIRELIDRGGREVGVGRGGIERAIRPSRVL